MATDSLPDNDKRAKAREAERKYRQSAKGKANRKAYYAANVDALRAKGAAIYAASGEMKKRERRAYYLANKEAMYRASRDWLKRNPEAERAIKRRRRARKNGAEGTHTAADVQRIGDAQKWRCHWCAKPTKKKYHVDHIQPLAKGGSNWPSNLCIACPTCNHMKHASDPIEFARRLGRLL